MILITGATGHSGTHLIERLKKEKCKESIKCLVRKNSNLTTLKNSGLDISYIIGDLEDASLIEECMKGVSIVIHIANIVYSEAIAIAALRNNVSWGIFVHTTGRYSKFKSAAADYIRIEESVMRCGLSYTILRPTMIYGSSKDRNIFKLIDYLHRHKVFPVFGNGKNLMQPIHAKDLGNAIYQAFANRNKTEMKEYNLAGKYPITYKDLLLTVSNVLNKNNIFIHLPYAISLFGAHVYSFFSKSPMISIEQVMRMNEDKIFSYENAAEDFGFEPVSFEEGIVDEIHEYLKSVTGKNN